jgi:excisionase family DNA binding protein
MSTRPANNPSSGGYRQRSVGSAGVVADLHLPPVLDLPQAAALLGVGRTTAYRLVHDKLWPTPVLRLGRLIRIPTQPLLDLLAGVQVDASAGPHQDGCTANGLTRPAD